MKPNNNRSNTRSTSAPRAATTARRSVALVAPTHDDSHDVEMGAQLTDQFHRATNGQIEVFKFGAMMMILEARLDVSAREHNRARRGPTAKGDGVKGWLEKYASEVNRCSAYRFMNMAKIIAAEAYTGIVGLKIAKQFALPQLVTTPPNQLPEKARAKQLELFNNVRGTSQRSWLDRFKPEHTTGGKTYERENGKGQRKTPTAEQQLALLHTLATTAAKAVRAVVKEKAFIALKTAAERDSYIGDLESALAAAKQWDKLTDSYRSDALAEWREELQMKASRSRSRKNTLRRRNGPAQ